MYPFLSGSYLVLETTNQCNLACVHCAVSEQGHEHHQTTGFLPLHIANDLFKNLSLSKISFDTLILFWLGEPTLHPCFSDIYQIALRHSVRNGIFNHIEVHSNCILLTESHQRTLLNSASIPQKLHVSLDAQNEETYKSVKGRSGLQQAQENTKKLLLRKKKQNCLWPRVVLQFIVGDNNYREAESFFTYWRDFLSEHSIPFSTTAGHISEGTEVVLFFRQLDAPNPQKQNRENYIFYETIKKLGIPLLTTVAKEDNSIDEHVKNNYPCSGFWKSPTIDWKGNLTFCTRDNHLLNTIGNITQIPFDALWTSQKVQKIRQRIQQGDYRKHRLCQSCFIPQSLNHSEISEQEIEYVQYHASKNHIQSNQKREAKSC
jgi:radical SAM protein with 4Fe4S-binding SPASM domain